MTIQDGRCLDSLTTGLKFKLYEWKKIIAKRPLPPSGNSVGLGQISQVPSNETWIPVIPSKPKISNGCEVNYIC